MTFKQALKQWVQTNSQKLDKYIGVLIQREKTVVFLSYSLNMSLCLYKNGQIQREEAITVFVNDKANPKYPL